MENDFYLEKTDYLENVDECRFVLNSNPSVQQYFKATNDFKVLCQVKEYYKLSSIKDAYNKLYDEIGIYQMRFLDYEGIYKVDVPFVEKTHNKTVFNYIENKNINMEEINKFIDVSSNIINIVDSYTVVKNGNKYIVSMMIFKGKNGGGHNVFLDTQNVIDELKKLYDLGYKFRMSDASYDMVDDVSSFVVQVFFENNGKPTKEHYKIS